MLLEVVKQLVLLTGYMTQNAFPQPLDEAEEARCLERLQQGDQDARDELIRHNLRLVDNNAKKASVLYSRSFAASISFSNAFFSIRLT